MIPTAAIIDVLLPVEGREFRLMGVLTTVEVEGDVATNSAGATVVVGTTTSGTVVVGPKTCSGVPLFETNTGV